MIPPAVLNSLLPLFLENAHSVAMIKHSIDVINAAVQHLKPGQVTVISADQPLYAMAKQIQWTWSYTHGEDSFVIMFGGLHIEMAVLTVIAADQPLYAMAKQIQWTWPYTHGEDSFVIMFGGLHIKMAVLKVSTT